MRSAKPRKAYFFIAVLLCANVLLSAAGATRDWTFLVYMAANNNLEEDALANLDDMLKAESSRANIVVMVDRGMEYSQAGVGGIRPWSGAKRFVVQGGRLKELADLGKIDSTDPAQVSSFLSWGIKNFPASRYAFVLWDHGGAWTGFASSELNPEGGLSAQEIREAVATALASTSVKKLDLLGFDACLMANYEAIAALQGLASYYLASEELEPGHGWRYTSLKEVFDSGGDAVALGTAILAGYREVAIEADDWDEVTLSLLDLSRFGELTKAVAAFAHAAQGKIASLGPALGRCAGKSPTYGKAANPAEAMNLVDLGAFASRVGADDPSLASSSAAVAAALESALVAQVVGDKNKGSTGLSVYFPARKAYYDEGYDDKGSAEWRALLAAYFGNGKAAAEELAAGDVAFGFSTEDAEVGKGEDGWTVSAPLSEGSADMAVEFDLSFGIREGGDVTFFGSIPAELSEDGGEVWGVWDGQYLVVSQGELSSPAYFEVYIEDDDTLSLAIPFAYFVGKEPTDDYTGIDLVLSIDENGEIVKESWYAEAANGTYGSFRPKKGSHIVPIAEVFHDDDEESEFVALAEDYFDPAAEFDFAWEDFERGQKALVQLEIYDANDAFGCAAAEFSIR